MIKKKIKEALMAVSYEACAEQLERIEKQNNELIYAEVWKDTIRGIEWCKSISSLSPGRWAVGYNYLYVMTRILEELHPHSVLDFGLGISTSLITTYFKNMDYDDGIHYVLEHNEEWVKFYTNSHDIAKDTHIHICRMKNKEMDGIEYCAYDDISPAFIKRRKYKVISIDAPYGSDEIARRDIVDYLPDCLESEFVIVMDDAERSGEQHTCQEIEQKLKSNGIEYEKGLYRGTSDCVVIASKKIGYLCTL